VIGSMLDLSQGRRDAFVPLVGAWLSRRGVEAEPGSIEVVEVEVLLAGRPGLLDVVARVGARVAHLVLGLHAEGSELRMLRGSEDAVLGEFRDEQGTARAVDALFDVELAPLLMIAIVGEEPGVVALVRDDDTAVVLDVEDRCTFSVFPWLTDGGHPAVEMLVRMDEAGFNHLAAPIALWRRQGRDLGVVQEQLTEQADGWALAMSSLRDLYGSRVPPEEAGGDFAVEARSLGTMTARMHLASDKAFGRRELTEREWVAQVDSLLGRAGPAADSGSATARPQEGLLADQGRHPFLRPHGDLHLGRVARTNQGWVVADWWPGGADASGVPLFRSPLADVADICWSLRHVAVAALEERDLALRPRLEASAEAWAARNRRAFLSGYLGTAGVDELLPASAEATEELIALFERERSAARGPGTAPG